MISTTMKVMRTGAVALGATLAVAVLTPAAHAAGGDLEDPQQLGTGHVDVFNISLNDDDSIRLNLKEDVTGSHVHRTPESVELVVKEQALRTGLPAAYLPPGAPTELYHLPLTQDQDLVWPGWDSLEASAYYGTDADTDIVVSDVRGPGDIYLWTQGPFGDVRQVLSGGYTLPDTIHQTDTAHAHANWGFTAPGTYRITAHATVTSEDGTRTSTSDTMTYTFVVGEQSGGDPETSVSISGMGAHYHTGDVVVLDAVQSPQVSDRYRWSTKGSADGGWTTVEGAESATYGFVVTGAHQVRVEVLGADGSVLAVSDPADVLVDDHGSTPVVGPELEVSLPSTEGALVVSVSSEGRRATLDDLSLNPAADRYVSTGEITGVTVTDTRQANLGWSATARVRGLVTVDGGTLDGKYLGWTPKVVSATGLTAVPGDSVAPGFVDGQGIKDWSALGSAAPGSSIGSAVLGADLAVEAPLTTTVGKYQGVVLLTVV